MVSSPLCCRIAAGCSLRAAAADSLLQHELTSFRDCLRCEEPHSDCAMVVTKTDSSLGRYMQRCDGTRTFTSALLSHI